MTRIALLALLALAGCSTAGLPAQQACEIEANDDPVVHRIRMIGLGNPHRAHEDTELVAAARQDAVLTCLRRRGVLRPGGVERQKPI